MKTTTAKITTRMPITIATMKAAIALMRAKGFRMTSALAKVAQAAKMATA